MSRPSSSAKAALLLSVFVAAAGIRPSPARAESPSEVAAAAPAEPASAPVRATLNVDASAVGEAGSVLESRIRAKVDQLRLQEEVLPGSGEQDPIITVIVRSLSGEAIGYEVEVSVQHRGEVLEDTFRTEQCKLCTEGEVVEQAESMVAALVPRLRSLSQTDAAPGVDPVAPAATPVTPAEEIVPPAKLTTPPDNQRKPLQAMGKVGIALLVLGTAGIATGTGLALAKPKGNDDIESWQYVDLRPAGFGVVAAGGAVFITGIVLLGVDRQRARARTAWVVPQVGPHGGGLAWVGRF